MGFAGVLRYIYEELNELQSRRGRGALSAAPIGKTAMSIEQFIDNELKGTDVVLFMKGTPVFPQCGFSAAVVQILTHMGVKFKGVDVLADPALRQGIKDFSSWPTIPQLYVKGEFVGGCDIVREMFESGELKDLMQTKGVSTRAA